jgi:hypothetical protein
MYSILSGWQDGFKHLAKIYHEIGLPDWYLWYILHLINKTRRSAWIFSLGMFRNGRNLVGPTSIHWLARLLETSCQ